VQSERRELGIDHALVGGVLARRFSLPATVASVIEQHHNPAATGAPAIVRLADMLAHYLAGAKVAPAAMTSAASNLDISAGQLRELLYELPVSTAASRAHQVVPCPLSSREIEVLRGLAKSMVYKQIASSMGLSTSTVRTHLHNVYGKLGVMDRAQAVLIATERGWL
jgi:DNA-binding NarL/FixJ family response regulator